MRIIHTSDWHLGKLFYGVYLTGEQAYVLDEFVLLLKDERPDLLIIAGDIYDRAVPPPPAAEQRCRRAKKGSRIEKAGHRQTLIVCGPGACRS